MNLLIIFVLTVATVFGLPGKEIKPRNIVVPAGRPEGRVTNGHNAHEKQFKYQVGLIQELKDGKFSWCGGSLISNTEILTAAHCTEDVVSVQVLMGTINRDQPKVMHTVSAKNIIIHPQWNTNTVENDISIIKIPYTPYSEYIQAIKLPSKGTSYSTFAGENAVISGWGRISDNDNGPTSYLQYANLNIIPNKACGRTFAIDSTNICVSTYGGISTCHGDSGGPLVLQSSNILVGVASFVAGDGCEKNLPAAFTRVTSYLDWIQQHSNVAL